MALESDAGISRPTGSVVALTTTSASAPSGSPHSPPLSIIAFDKMELSVIFGLYGRMVASGEWRDYALDFTPQRAVFSIFRRTSETPLYRVVKDPRSARRQGAYSVLSSAGVVLKRGPDLRRVIAAIEPKPSLSLV